MFERDSANFFIGKYNIDEKVAGAKNVSLYAEVSDKPEFPEQGAYKLDLFLAIEPLGFRSFLIGMIFGEKNMTREDMQDYVDHVVKSQLANNFTLHVEGMFEDERILDTYRP